MENQTNANQKPMTNGDNALINFESFDILTDNKETNNEIMNNIKDIINEQTSTKKNKTLSDLNNGGVRISTTTEGVIIDDLLGLDLNSGNDLSANNELIMQSNENKTMQPDEGPTLLENSSSSHSNINIIELLNEDACLSAAGNKLNSAEKCNITDHDTLITVEQISNPPFIESTPTLNTSINKCIDEKCDIDTIIIGHENNNSTDDQSIPSDISIKKDLKSETNDNSTRNSKFTPTPSKIPTSPTKLTNNLSKISNNVPIPSDSSKNDKPETKLSTNDHSKTPAPVVSQRNKDLKIDGHHHDSLTSPSRKANNTKIIGQETPGKISNGTKNISAKMEKNIKNETEQKKSGTNKNGEKNANKETKFEKITTKNDLKSNTKPQKQNVTKPATKSNNVVETKPRKTGNDIKMKPNDIKINHPTLTNQPPTRSGISQSNPKHDNPSTENNQKSRLAKSADVTNELGNAKNVNNNNNNNRAVFGRSLSARPHHNKIKLSLVSANDNKATTRSLATTPKTPDILGTEIKSKIGSLDNAKHAPGGGNVKISSQKIDLSNVTSKCGSKDNMKHTPRGGDKKIESKKLEWKVESKIGSLDNAKYKPGGGDKKIENIKLEWNVTSKVGSLDNAQHVPKGGDKKIETIKLDFKDKAQSKVGSKDYIQHKPGGGNIKIESQKLNFSEKAKSRINASFDPAKSSQKDSQNSIEQQQEEEHLEGDQEQDCEREVFDTHEPQATLIAND